MRCLSCNKLLSDHEATRKYATSGTFVDLCNGCFEHVESDIPVIDGKGENDSDDYDAEWGFTDDDGSDTPLY